MWEVACILNQYNKGWWGSRVWNRSLGNCDKNRNTFPAKCCHLWSIFLPSHETIIISFHVHTSSRQMSLSPFFRWGWETLFGYQVAKKWFELKSEWLKELWFLYVREGEKALVQDPSIPLCALISGSCVPWSIEAICMRPEPFPGTQAADDDKRHVEGVAPPSWPLIQMWLLMDISNGHSGRTWSLW